MDLSISYFEISSLIIIIARVPEMILEFATALILVFDEVYLELISLEGHLLLRNFLDLVLLESEVVQISVVASAATRETSVSCDFPIARPFQLEHLLRAAQVRRLLVSRPGSCRTFYFAHNSMR